MGSKDPVNWTFLRIPTSNYINWIVKWKPLEKFPKTVRVCPATSSKKKGDFLITSAKDVWCNADNPADTAIDGWQCLHNDTMGAESGDRRCANRKGVCATTWLTSTYWDLWRSMRSMKFSRDHFTNWIQSGMVEDAPKKLM
jgi:hypothetical protein